jgi:hypothetical protein
MQLLLLKADFVQEVLPEDITFKPYETVADTLKRCKTLLNAEFALFLQMVGISNT